MLASPKTCQRPTPGRNPTTVSTWKLVFQQPAGAKVGPRLLTESCTPTRARSARPFFLADPKWVSGSRTGGGHMLSESTDTALPRTTVQRRDTDETYPQTTMRVRKRNG